MRQRGVQSALDVDGGQLGVFALAVGGQLHAFSTDVGLLGIGLGTDRDVLTWHIDIAPATKPAMPATRMLLRLDSAAATPTIKLAVETIPSLAPSTAARSHPMRWVR